VKTLHPVPRAALRGAALVIVMLVLLLASLLVLAGGRLGWLHQVIVGSERDHQQAFAAAEALLRDAENDVRGRQADGSAVCAPRPGFVGCRNWKDGQPFFPEDDDDLADLSQRVLGSSHGCRQGICVPASLDSLDPDLWRTALPALTAGTGAQAVAARYGEHTGAPPSEGHALLRAESPARAWYWVEVFRYSDAPGLTATAQLPVPDAARPFVYRITAFVLGHKAGTRVLLRSVFVPYPREQLE
jgi:type IV pilus assembly protein PilX